LPKIKTNRAAKKRLKKTASGEYKRSKANKGHLLTKKKKKRKKNLAKATLVSSRDKKKVKRLLP